MCRSRVAAPCYVCRPAYAIPNCTRRAMPKTQTCQSRNFNKISIPRKTTSATTAKTRKSRRETLGKWQDITQNNVQAFTRVPKPRKDALRGSEGINQGGARAPSAAAAARAPAGRGGQGCKPRQSVDNPAGIDAKAPAEHLPGNRPTDKRGTGRDKREGKGPRPRPEGGCTAPAGNPALGTARDATGREWRGNKGEGTGKDGRGTRRRRAKARSTAQALRYRPPINCPPRPGSLLR